MAEQIRFVDSAWLDANFPCMGGCPVHTEAGRYVALIEEGRFREAYHVARRPNPFASICGLVCAAPCETACRRGKLDEPIAIRALKRFVCERFGVESMVDLERLREVFGKSVRKNGVRVAVVGAGPAGLACAIRLKQLRSDLNVCVLEKGAAVGAAGAAKGQGHFRANRRQVKERAGVLRQVGGPPVRAPHRARKWLE